MRKFTGWIKFDVDFEVSDTPTDDEIDFAFWEAVDIAYSERLITDCDYWETNTR